VCAKLASSKPNTRNALRCPNFVVFFSLGTFYNDDILERTWTNSIAIISKYFFLRSHKRFHRGGSMRIRRGFSFTLSFYGAFSICSVVVRRIIHGLHMRYSLASFHKSKFRCSCCSDSDSSVVRELGLFFVKLFTGHWQIYYLISVDNPFCSAWFFWWSLVQINRLRWRWYK
jgi:hypothetical protein